ncbi:MAG: hypothetical protein NT135_00485 [Candidatus Berkelbacteria bacterium]|nr:hypothetical protein [Candidatus Berkelbacteria bacterium]
MAKPLSNALVTKIMEENGCFSLIYRRDRHLDRGGRRIYFYFRPHFAVTMKDDKKDLIDQITDTIDCGKVTSGKGQARVDVFSPTDAKKIIKLMDKHNFENRAKKKEFSLWKEAVEVITRNNKKKVNAEKGKRGFISTWANFNERDLKRLFRIREEIKTYKKWKKTDYKWTNTLMARPY